MSTKITKHLNDVPRVWKVAFTYVKRASMQNRQSQEITIPGDVSWTKAVELATAQLGDRIGPAHVDGERTVFIVDVRITRESWRDEVAQFA